MEKTGVSSMAGSVVQDVWDWEVLPEEHRSFYAETRPAAPSHGGGGGEVPLGGDQETEEPILDPSEDGDNHHASEVSDKYKDIGVMPARESRSGAEEESMVAPPRAVTELPPPVSGVDGEEEGNFHSSGDAKEVDDGKPVAPEEAAPPPAGEEEEMMKKKIDRTRAPAPCVVFSVGKLKVNGIGALCSFGVAAATVCVFLVGGKLQHQQKLHQQQEKLQLQFLGDDKRMQQVVQQTSRLNQAMSSVMGGSTRANISFGGFYDGF